MVSHIHLLTGMLNFVITTSLVLFYFISSLCVSFTSIFRARCWRFAPLYVLKCAPRCELLHSFDVDALVALRVSLAPGLT